MLGRQGFIALVMGKHAVPSEQKAGRDNQTDVMRLEPQGAQVQWFEGHAAARSLDAANELRQILALQDRPDGHLPLMVRWNAV